MSQFPQDQGATTKVYPTILRGGVDAGIVEIGHIPEGCGDFPVPLRYASVAVYQAQLPRQALRIQENLSQRGLEVFSRWVLVNRAGSDTLV